MPGRNSSRAIPFPDKPATAVGLDAQVVCFSCVFTT